MYRCAKSKNKNQYIYIYIYIYLQPLEMLRRSSSAFWGLGFCNSIWGQVQKGAERKYSLAI